MHRKLVRTDWLGHGRMLMRDGIILTRLQTVLRRFRIIHEPVQSFSLICRASANLARMVLTRLQTVLKRLRIIHEPAQSSGLVCRASPDLARMVLTRLQTVLKRFRPTSSAALRR